MSNEISTNIMDNGNFVIPRPQVVMRKVQSLDTPGCFNVMDMRDKKILIITMTYRW